MPKMPGLPFDPETVMPFHGNPIPPSTPPKDDKTKSTENSRSYIPAKLPCLPIDPESVHPAPVQSNKEPENTQLTNKSPIPESPSGELYTPCSSSEDSKRKRSRTPVSIDTDVVVFFFNVDSNGNRENNINDRPPSPHALAQFRRRLFCPPPPLDPDSVMPFLSRSGSESSTPEKSQSLPTNPPLPLSNIADAISQQPIPAVSRLRHPPLPVDPDSIMPFPARKLETSFDSPSSNGSDINNTTQPKARSMSADISRISPWKRRSSASPRIRKRSPHKPRENVPRPPPLDPSKFRSILWRGDSRSPSLSPLTPPSPFPLTPPPRRCHSQPSSPMSGPHSPMQRLSLPSTPLSASLIAKPLQFTGTPPNPTMSDTSPFLSSLSISLESNSSTDTPTKSDIPVRSILPKHLFIPISSDSSHLWQSTQPSE